jgi:hypothetical protein
LGGGRHSKIEIAMPTTSAAILIIVLVILPGLLGDRVYKLLVGIDWREKEWRSILRLVAFSVAGAALYTLFAVAFSLIPVIHLIPKTYSDIQTGTTDINSIFLPYAGHLAGATLAGFAAGLGVLTLTKLSPRSPYPSAWDDFIRTHSTERWVVIGLQTGDVYAGQISNADLSAPTGDRDIVLAEPCLFDPEAGTYRANNYQYMFLKAESIYSIAAIYDQTRDTRLAAVGESLFDEEQANEHQKIANTTTTSTTVDNPNDSTGELEATTA